MTQPWYSERVGISGWELIRQFDEAFGMEVDAARLTELPATRFFQYLPESPSPCSSVTRMLAGDRSDLLDRGSCRLLNVNPETYLNWMLSKLAVATTKDVMALLPHDRLALTRL